MKQLLKISCACVALLLGASSASAEGKYDWTGWYVGGHIGGMFLDGDITIPPGGTSSMSDGSFTGGPQVGWNLQSDDFVLGIEADASFFDLKESHCGGGATTGQYGCGSFDADWLATIRGRAGLTFGAEGRTFVYGTGGLALLPGDFDVSVIFGNTLSRNKTSATFAVGGGVEHAYSDALSFKVEALYMNFGRFAFTNGMGASAVAEPDIFTVRAGVNWHFCSSGAC